MHFHRDVLAIADTFGKHLVRGRPDDVFTGTPPLAFTFGLGGLLVFPLRVGASTLLIERATPDRARRHRRAAPVPPCCSPRRPPTGPSCGRRQQDRLAGVAACGVGRRAPAAGGLAGVYDKTGIRPHRRHRQHRDAARVHLRRRRRHPARRHRHGRCPATAPPSSTPTATRSRTALAGRLAVHRPDRLPLPRRRPRRRSTSSTGWNVTGDTYVRDADGYFWYQARSDDMIVSSGYNIAAPEVERACSSSTRTWWSAPSSARPTPDAAASCTRVRGAARRGRRRPAKVASCRPSPSR